MGPALLLPDEARIVISPDRPELLARLLWVLFYGGLSLNFAHQRIAGFDDAPTTR
jgi:hypothetical protein